MVISINAVFLAIAYAPWMASFTETVEKHNPALVATGLAVWGWIIRAVIAISFLIMPLVVSSMTPLVTYGTQVATLSGQVRAPAGHAERDRPSHAGGAGGQPGEPPWRPSRRSARSPRRSRSARRPRPPGSSQVARGTEGGPAVLQSHGPAWCSAAAAAPGEWKNWWWICVGGEVVFIPLIFLMTGRWSPRRAREDAEAHERLVQDEMAKLQEQEA